ncbi:transformation system protein [Halarcobacter ebronensis]|uniref:Transformation system protein n=1 Tax=Halarcobacter ebronensis TaxID=1462615 RepID=A0A4Q0YH51_9BACT|nr:type II secretion system F family protein [Halarcobacter ebronensis]RXJ69653.1 transformation system protein [Halarcobacter ebronensis]
MLRNRYKITYQEKGVIKHKIVTKNELDRLKLPKNIISIKSLGFDIQLFKKIKDSKIKDKLYELTLMLSSNIKLNQAFDILIKNEKDNHFKEFLTDIKNSFINSIDIRKSMKKYSVNPLIISLFKLIQDSGNISENIKFLSELTRENQEIKGNFLKIMLYPMVLVVTFIFALIGIFEFVLPNFESLFKGTNYEMSIATKTLFLLKDISGEKIIIATISIFVLIIIFFRVYKNNNRLRVIADNLFIKDSFFVTRLNRLKILYIYFSVVHILLKNRYEFLEAINKAKVLLNNQYLFDKITQIENLLKSGKSVSFAFKSSGLFDDIVLSLIDTGELTNSLTLVVDEIKKIYKRRFENSLRLFSIMIEPIFFIIIMTLILWIIFAIFVPLWSMNDLLRF